MHAANNQGQIKISFQPVFFSIDCWKTSPTVIIYCFALLITASIFLLVSPQKPYKKKKVMTIYNVSKMELQCPGHICCPSSLCFCLQNLLHHPWLWQPDKWDHPSSGFCHSPWESFHSPAERKRPVTTADRENQQVQTVSWARREEHRENGRHFAQTQNTRWVCTLSIAGVGWPYTEPGHSHKQQHDGC